MQKIPSSRSLQTALATLTDPRDASLSEHRLLDILMIAICCLLCGGQSFTHMEQFGHAKLSWLRAFLELPHGIPSHDTFRRVFLLLDPQQFADVFLRWTQSLRSAVGAEVVALDGKDLAPQF